MRNGHLKRPETPKPPPLVSVAAIVGGMSPHKQKRILSRGVDVLVATPGRLWDIMQEVCMIQRPMERLLIHTIGRRISERYKISRFPGSGRGRQDD
jgi:NAD-dependent oxidoreductase involved in siderophore biosynthesis